jgi:hypothetical protein
MLIGVSSVQERIRGHRVPYLTSVRCCRMLCHMQLPAATGLSLCLTQRQSKSSLVFLTLVSSLLCLTLTLICFMLSDLLQKIFLLVGTDAPHTWSVHTAWRSLGGGGM